MAAVGWCSGGWGEGRELILNVKVSHSHKHIMLFKLYLLCTAVGNHQHAKEAARGGGSDIF